MSVRRTWRDVLAGTDDLVRAVNDLEANSLPLPSGTPTVGQVPAVSVVATPPTMVWADAGGAAGTPQVCWFEAAPVTGTSSLALVWVAISDGVAPFTDAIVGTDTATIEIVRTGTYLVRVSGNARENDVLGGSAYLTLALNDDSVGPLYDLLDKTGNLAQNEEKGLAIACPVDLAAGDLLMPSVNPQGNSMTLSAAIFTLIRLG